MRFALACIVVSCLLLVEVSAQNKAAFDLDPESLTLQQAEGSDASLRKSTAAAPDRAAIANTISAATLLRGGYFTFGTTGGASAERHDNNCQITYGHPYALTSFIELHWDGVWYKPDRFFPEYEQLLIGGADTIRLVMHKPGLCLLELRITHDRSNGALRLDATLRNLDTLPHDAALAMQIDPALGRWGDASLFINGTLLREVGTLTGVETSQAILLQEREQSVRGGLAALLTWLDEQPESVRIDNWQPALGPIFDASSDRPHRLFDTVLRPVWKREALQPHAEIHAALSIALPMPDFSTMAFIRWDMPTALTLDKGSLFPRDFPVMVEVYNTDSSPLSNAALHTAISPSVIPATKQSWPIAAGGMDFGYTIVQYKSNEVFEEMVVPVSIRCVMNGEILDSLTRYVYIPAVALSDTGLAVQIDTVTVDALPQVSVYFGIEDEATQVPVLAAGAENIWLWENGSRIRDFTLEKDARSSVNAVDVVFVLDVTGSMSGEIASVRNNIQMFADELSKKGISFRLGLVTFYDYIGVVHPPTSDVAQFQAWVAAQTASAGGDMPENSLEALYTAAMMTFRPEAHRLVVWITDADYHEKNVVTPRTVPEVLEALLAQAVTVHAIGAVNFKAEYDRIVGPTGGLFFDINGNFRDILLDISRFNVSTMYRLQYTTPAPSADPRRIEIKVHYAGKGGSAEWVSQAPPEMQVQARLACYPNPFNPAITMHVDNALGGIGWLAVVDGTGREVRRFALDGQRDSYRFVWDAGSLPASVPASGVYFIRLHLVGKGGTLLHKTTSVVYTK